MPPVLKLKDKLCLLRSHSLKERFYSLTTGVVGAKCSGNGGVMHTLSPFVRTMACMVSTSQAPGFMRLLCAISDATTGQLLRHYSPDLEVFRVLGATPGSTSGRVVGGGEVADLASMARWVIHRMVLLLDCCVVAVAGFWLSR